MKLNQQKYSDVFFAACFLLFFLFVWHIVSSQTTSATIPPPVRVFFAGLKMWESGELTQDLFSSLRRILIGFIIALLTGLFLGILAARYIRTYKRVSLLLELLSSIPPIAWTPIAILWFGIGDAPAFFIVFLGTFFPLFTGVYAGIVRTRTDMINAAKTLGASQSSIVLNVVIPSALPSILTGIKTGIGVGWFNVIAAELIGVRSGLGYKIQLNRTLLFSENVIALMIVIGIIGWLMARVVNFVGNTIAPWSVEDESRQKWMSRNHMFRRFINKFKTNNSSNIGVKRNLCHTKKDNKEELLKLNNISKNYPAKTTEDKLEVLKDINFVIHQGEIISIIGPNGCGKSTIIKLIAGLLPSDNGDIHFKGQRVTSPSKDRTVIFQDFALFPWKTAIGNILFALKSCGNCIGYDKHDLRKKAIMLLKEAGLSGFEDTYTVNLSGGMKQRLAVARALAVEPSLVLMDEPFASFDPIVRGKSQEAIHSLLAETLTTVLLVTHDLDEAIFMSNRVIVLSNRPAMIKKEIKINFSFPRSKEIRSSNEFYSIRSELWELLQNSPVNN